MEKALPGIPNISFPMVNVDDVPRAHIEAMRRDDLNG